MLKTAHAVSLTMTLTGVADAAASVLSSKGEWHVFQLGSLFGVTIALLWTSHRDAALTLLGGVIFLSLGQSRAPWSAEAAAARPLELMPWYFLTPVVGLLALRIGLGWLPHSVKKPIVSPLNKLLVKLES